MSRCDVLMLHGAGGGGWEWDLWRAVFEARGCRVATPDLRPVAAGLAATRFDDYRRQVDAALAMPSTRPRVLVGASLGGLLAAACADAVDALVLVNPLPPAPWHADLPLRHWPDVVPWGRHARLASTRRALPDADAATARRAMQGWRDESGRVLRDAGAGLAVARPACPVLCVVSTRDDDVPPAVTRAWAHAWQATVWVSPATSHVGPLLGNAAARTAAAASAWLDGLETGDAGEAAR
ncbi:MULTISPECIES: alpha/beta hydrolase [Luteimonas]|uniref:alpha/beta hydrolase n=1 Tax=Luteimonas TaxID=83614 RepID=UPI000C7D9001|nr:MULTISPECIES: alpha/beta hydrolase [Luteimonas]